MDLKQDLDENYQYSPKELAFLWNLDDETIRRLFVNEPGVMVLDNTRAPKPKCRRQNPRIYRTLRIPGTVAIRVKLRMTIAPDR
jgi:hypothetical protein